MKILISSWILVLLAAPEAEFAATKSAKCRTNAHCADSGTICATKPRHDADTSVSDFNSHFTLDTEPLLTAVAPTGDTSNDAFDPPTDDDPDLAADDGNSEEFADDASIAGDADAVVAIPTGDPKKVQLKKGVKVTPTKSDAEKGEIIIGSSLVINGWKCVVTAITQPKESNTKGASVDVAVITDFGGNNPPARSDDSMDTAPAQAEKLANGKIVKIGPVNCKITGRNQKTALGGTTTALTTLKALISATSKKTTSQTTPRSAPQTTFRSAPQTTSQTSKSSGSVGICTCDSVKRFACTTDDDCFTRFRESNVQCFPTSLCDTELGPGYCRRSGDSVLEDQGIEQEH